MTTARDQFTAIADPLSKLVDTIPPDGWAKPSPCEGWTAADVVDHLISTENDFLATQGIDVPEQSPQDSPAVRWEAQREFLTGLLADESVVSKTYQGFFGPSTIGDTLTTFYGFDLVAHRWDIAQAVGTDTDFTEAELDLMEKSIASFGDHMYAEGICKPAVEVGPGASRKERVLAAMGRRPDGS